jgi:hypothetical protein
MTVVRASAVKKAGARKSVDALARARAEQVHRPVGVPAQPHGLKRYHHPVVCELSLDYEIMEFRADTGLTLTAYSAQPGTPSHDGLNLLASWAATIDQTHNADTGQTTNHPS